MNSNELLAKLGLAIEPAINPAACADGEWRTGTGKFDSINPTNREAIASAGSATEADYEAVLVAAQKAAEQWRKVPAPKRGDVVRRLGELLRENKDALGSLVTLEMGKIKAEGDGEVQEMIDIADFAVGLSRQLYGKTMHSERPGHRMYEQWHPLGVVGVISAFNFPVAVWAWNACIAAVCGNAVVWRPSPKTPLTALAVQHLCNRAVREAGAPAIFGLFIEAENTLVKTLVADRRVPLVSFTGSSQVGREVAMTVAGRFGKSLLECAGNNAIIVDTAANLELAVPSIVFGAVGTAGQRCTTTRRLLVHESRIDELLPRLVSAYKQVSSRVGDPLEAGTLLGPLIDQVAVDNFRKAVADAREQGGEVLVGGDVMADRPGFYVQPTIIRMSAQTAVMQHETFAPILYVMTYRDLDDALRLHNEVPQGLSSAIFTDTLQTAETFLSHGGSDCGIANVNIGTSGAEIGGAFGGEKETGGGREAGSDSWQLYMRRQTNTINWSRDLPLAQGIKFDLS